MNLRNSKDFIRNCTTGLRAEQIEYLDSQLDRTQTRSQLIRQIIDAYRKATEEGKIEPVMGKTMNTYTC
jgi:hypothetical protein